MAAKPGFADIVLVGFAWCIYTVALWHSNLTIDVARDLVQAHLIASGADFPLRGPMIGSATYLGPLWFYLLAPAAVFGSTVVMATWAGLLAGSKFLFGWLLGVAIAGPRAGRGVVVALALPSWMGFEWLVFSHTNLVAATTLAFLWGCLGLWREPRTGWAVFLIAVSVLMLHAHPSQLPLLALALPGFVRALGRRQIAVAPLLIAILGAIALHAAPWFADSAGDRTPGAAAMLPQWDALITAPQVLLQLLAAIAIDGPGAIVHLIETWSPNAATLHGLLSAGLLVAGAMGLAVAEKRVRTAIAIIAVVLVIQLYFIAIVKPLTPFYMAYGGSTLVALAIGLALGRTPGSGVSSHIGLPFVGVLLGIQFLAFQGISGSGVQQLPFALGEIGSRHASIIPGPGAEQLSPLAADRVAAHVCRSPTPVHGSLAIVLDLAYGLPLQMGCQTSLAELMAGSGPDQGGQVGLPASAWQALEREPDLDLGQWGLASGVRVIRYGVVTWARYRSSADYPPRLWRSDEPRTTTVSLDLSAGETLIVTSLEHVFGNNQPVVARLDGHEVDASWRSEWTAIWGPSSDAPRKLTLELSGRSVESIEIVALRAP
jgi:hypothetical protein